jgi:transketolase
VCVLGDGELQEGQNWEAMMAAAHYRVAGLTAIVDRNRLQNDGDTETILALGDLASKARAFGWGVEEIDGHDFAALDAALGAAPDGRPRFVIANTVKGKGVSFMEGVVHWHHHPVGAEDLAHALAELA